MLSILFHLALLLLVLVVLAKYGTEIEIFLAPNYKNLKEKIRSRVGLLRK